MRDPLATLPPIRANARRAAGAAAKPFTLASGTRRAATITAAPADAPAKDAAGKPTLGSFSGNAYTGVPMNPEGYGIPIVCDYDGFDIPSQHRPVLRQHDHEQVVGHTDSVKVDPKQGVMISGVFSGEKHHVEKVTTLAKNGFQWQLSIGADPVQTEHLEAGETAEVNGRTVTGPLIISRKTKLGEISFVPLGADGDTHASVKASKRKVKVIAMFTKTALKLARSQGIKAAMKFSDDEIDKMTDGEAKAALKKCMAADGDDDDKKPDVDAEDDEDVKAGDDDKDTEAEDEDDVKAADDDEDEDDVPPAKAKASGKGRKGIRANGGTGGKRLTVNRMLANRKAEAAETRRISGIRAACRKHGNADTLTVKVNGKDVNLESHAIEAGWTKDKTELYILRANRPGANVGSPHFYSPSAATMSDAVLEAAVFQAARHEFKLPDDEFYQDTNDNGRTTRRVNARLQREIQSDLKTRYPDRVMQAAHDLFKGRASLQQILVAAAAANGYRGSEVIRDDSDIQRVFDSAFHARGGAGRIHADGSSTASLANVLANVLNKTLLQGYLYVEQSWREVSAIASVKDFKPTKSVNLFGDFTFDAVGPNGELKNGALRDQAFANQAEQYGKILTINRKNIINDDLGALTKVPMLMGRGAGLKLNKTFWTTFLNPGNDDGGSTAFWATAHTLPPGQYGKANLVTGAGSALSSSALQLAKQTFEKQVDPNGDPLGIDPEILLYPLELDQTAWELLNSQSIVYGGATAAKQGDKNRWVGKYKPVMSRYLSNDTYTGYSAAACYLLANPGLMPVIEACFLNGTDVPKVEQAGPDYQFGNLGISVRGVFDFGVNSQNFRGGVKLQGT